MTIRVVREFTADNMIELDDHLQKLTAYFNATYEWTHVLMKAHTGDSDIRIITTDYPSLAAYEADMQQRQADSAKPSPAADLRIRNPNTLILVHMET